RRGFGSLAIDKDKRVDDDRFDVCPTRNGPTVSLNRRGRGLMAGRLVLSVAVLVLSALLVLGSTTKAEPYHVTIGFTVSESGPYAAGSAGMREGLELWRDDVNARGGIRVGGVAHTVRFVTYNDASDPERVRDLYHRLITQDRVDFLVAPYSSSLGSVA